MKSNHFISLAPGFSPVLKKQNAGSRFNGFSRERKAVSTADAICCRKITGLKPGANEKSAPKKFTRRPVVPGLLQRFTF
jgi:hypothetical protein